MKTKILLISIIFFLLMVSFFFKFPVPVENQEGANDKQHFIYGGMYWTSGLYQLSVGNYPAMIFYFLIFITLFLTIYLMEFKN